MVTVPLLLQYIWKSKQFKDLTLLFWNVEAFVFKYT